MRNAMRCGRVLRCLAEPRLWWARCYARVAQSEELADSLPTVVLIGRPNVGKSALYNRLVGRREALVYNTPAGHVTRDYREAVGSLGDLQFRVVDTSGIEPGRPNHTLQGRAAQLTAAVVKRSDVTLLLIDATTGVVPADEELAQWLLRVLPRQSLKQLVLVANKAETRTAQNNMAQTVADCHTLSLSAPLVAMSATSGEGLTDLYAELQPRIDAAVAALQSGEQQLLEQQQQQQQQQQQRQAPKKQQQPTGEPPPASHAATLQPLDADEEVFETPGATKPAQEDDQDSAVDRSQGPVRIAIMGLPNAGKSTLMNQWLGWERSLTGPEAGLTRDPPAAWLLHGDTRVQLVDTAGWLRRAALAGTRGLPQQAPSTSPAAGGTAAGPHSSNAYGQAAGHAGGPPHSSSSSSSSSNAAQQGDEDEELEQQLLQGLQEDSAGVLAPEVRAALLAAAQQAARRAMQAAHVMVLLLDAPKLQQLRLAITKVELQLASLAVHEGKALLVVLNKADAVKGGPAAAEKLRLAVQGVLEKRFLEAGRLPVLSCSAGDGSGTREVLDAAVDAYERWNRRYSTNQLMRLVEQQRLKLMGRGGAASLLERIKWLAQVKTRPPGFAVSLRGSNLRAVDESGQRFLANTLRQALNLQGLPVRLYLRYARTVDASAPPLRARRAGAGRRPR